MVIVLISILYIFTLVAELADCRVAGRGLMWDDQLHMVIVLSLLRNASCR